VPPLHSFCSGFGHFPVPNCPNVFGFFSPLKAFGAQKIQLIGIIDMSIKIPVLIHANAVSMGTGSQQYFMILKSVL
jgi:hypothetical protein